MAVCGREPILDRYVEADTGAGADCEALLALGWAGVGGGSSRSLWGRTRGRRGSTCCPGVKLELSDFKNQDVYNNSGRFVCLLAMYYAGDATECLEPYKDHAASKIVCIQISNILRENND